jgi:hypothetical protein
MTGAAAQEPTNCASPPTERVHDPGVVDEEGVARVVAALASDVSVTMGWDRAESEAFVRRAGGIDHLATLDTQDVLSLAENAVTSLQNSIHGQGQGIDNTWPLCPRHGSHPLVCGSDLVWRCPAEDHDDPEGFFAGVPIGWLDAIFDGHA